MKILLYGGTFDPPHIGHLHNLQSVAACVRPDQVIVMPAGIPPHKAASQTPAPARLAMCDCFLALAGTADIPRLEVSRWEIDRAAAGEANYTQATLEMLAKRFPGAVLYLAVGSDMLLSFDTWHNWRQDLALATLVVESRETDDAAALRAKAAELDPTGQRVLFAAAPALPMSSTALRGRLAAGDACEDALPPKVRAVIARRGLYRAAKI
ncbi:MAG: nicotinate (nicotinamide) nucleotide adenylyltransferase [Faecalibacterium sp.]|jgi:nicotinate-nucleotide adenylyltransferase|nr:nicotinate (nicotinamide) nucleotide adenylyltransferase [Faecalibacterium sp.]